MASSKREKELARQRAERQAARRTAAAAKRKQRTALVAAAAAVAVVLVALLGVGVFLRGGEDDPDQLATAPLPSSAPSDVASAAPSSEPSTDASPAVDGEKTCTYEQTSEPAAKEVALPPPTGIETEQQFVVTVATNRGDIVFETDTAGAPCTVQSLRSLAHFTYFDDTPCHRLTTEGIKVLQCGDPSGTGGGGPGYQFADENLEGATYPKGTVAMANAGPGTNGSQFFLVYEDSLSLPANYTPFGRITEGLDLLAEVAEAGSDESNGVGDGKPKQPVQIETLRLKPKAA